MSAMPTLHGTCVEIGGSGVLLQGESGSGKSDLALRLIESGARLVADDQVVVAREGESVKASPPENLRGLIEVRGLGILRLPHIPEVPLSLAVSLGAPERMPEPETRDILGCGIPLVRLAPFEASAPAKVRLALQSILTPDMVAS